MFLHFLEKTSQDGREIAKSGDSWQLCGTSLLPINREDRSTFYLSYSCILSVSPLRSLSSLLYFHSTIIGTLLQLPALLRPSLCPCFTVFLSSLFTLRVLILIVLCGCNKKNTELLLLLLRGRLALATFLHSVCTFIYIGETRNYHCPFVANSPFRTTLPYLLHSPALILPTLLYFSLTK